MNALRRRACCVAAASSSPRAEAWPTIIGRARNAMSAPRRLPGSERAADKDSSAVRALGRRQSASGVVCA